MEDLRDQSMYLYGHITDMFLTFMQAMFAGGNYEGYRWDPNEEITEIFIDLPFQKNLTVVGGKPKVVIVLGDLVFKNQVMGDRFREDVANYDIPQAYEDVHIDMMDTNLKILVASNEWYEAHKLAYIIAMQLKAYTPDIEKYSAGRVIACRVQSVTAPNLIDSDSDTETFVCQIGIYLLLQDKWTKVDDDAPPLDKIEAGFCAGDGTMSNIIVTLEAEDED